VWATLVVGDGEGLPSSVEWLVNAAQGALVFGRGRDGVYEVHVRNARAVPAQDAAVTLQLVPGQGLVAPSGRLSRRRSDRREAFAGRVLLISSDDTPAGDLEKWVRGTFTTQVTSDPVTALQGPEGFESVLLFTSRRKVREALAIIREIRPVTASPIIVASDDAVRSMDRVDMLEAGADDCLTGGVDVRELAARMRQAVRRGGKSPSDSDRRTPQERFTLGGLVEGADFDDELRRRAADPTLGVFGVIHVRASGTSLEELESVIADEIRADEGDLVKRDTDGVVVLLQGARGGASKAFLDRFRRRMQHHLGSDPGIEPDVFAHPADRERILAVLNGSGGR
jgi:CheY-like chemotaxis protein